MYIHKAVSPKHMYKNPTKCSARISEKAAHRDSRTSWKKVNCPRCLAMMGKMKGKMKPRKRHLPTRRGKTGSWTVKWSEMVVTVSNQNTPGLEVKLRSGPHQGETSNYLPDGQWSPSARPPCCEFAECITFGATLKTATSLGSFLDKCILRTSFKVIQQNHYFTPDEHITFHVLKSDVIITSTGINAGRIWMPKSSARELGRILLMPSALLCQRENSATLRLSWIMQA